MAVGTDSKAAMPFPVGMPDYGDLTPSLHVSRLPATCHKSILSASSWTVIKITGSRGWTTWVQIVALTPTGWVTGKAPLLYKSVSVVNISCKSWWPATISGDIYQ